MALTPSELQRKVANLVGKYPKTATWTQEGAYSTATMSNAAGTPKTVTVSPPTGFHPRMIDGDTIETSDVQVVLPSLDLTFTPKTGDKVVIDSTNYRVEGVTPLDVGALVVGYEIQLRKG